MKWSRVEMLELQLERNKLITGWITEVSPMLMLIYRVIEVT